MLSPNDLTLPQKQALAKARARAAAAQAATQAQPASPSVGAQSVLAGSDQMIAAKPQAPAPPQSAGAQGVIAGGRASSDAMAQQPYASVDDAINGAAKQYGQNFMRDTPLPEGYAFVKGSSDPFSNDKTTPYLRDPQGMLWTQDKWADTIRSARQGIQRDAEGDAAYWQGSLDDRANRPLLYGAADALHSVTEPVGAALGQADKALMDAGGRLAYKLDPKGVVPQAISDFAPAVGSQTEKLGTLLNGVIPGASEAGRQVGEGLTQFAATTARNPIEGITQATDLLEPTHIVKEGIEQGDGTKVLMGALGLLPGAPVIDAMTDAYRVPARAMEKSIAGIAPRTAKTAEFGSAEGFARPAMAPEVVPLPEPPIAPPVAPAASGPAPFSLPPQATPKGNVVARNADRIVGAALGASIGGGGGDAWAASGGDGGGGNPVGTGAGAIIGAIAPRAAAHGLGRVVNKFGASETVAARAVRNALKSAGITSREEALAAGVGRFGDKPATIADLSQEGVSLGTGISRLPGVAGPQARARYDDLLEARPGRLERDIGQAAPSLHPATISGDIEALAKEAQSQAKPAYDALRAQHAAIKSPRLDQLRETTALKPHVDAVERYRQNQKTTNNRHVGDFEFWDLVKRDMDAKEQQLIAKGATMSDIRLREIEDARSALVEELDKVVPNYAAARDLGGVAPILKSDYKQGQKLLGGQYRAEDVQRLIAGMTGRPMTALQAGVIRKMVDKTDGARGAMAALMSARNQSILREVFGPEVAEQLQRRFAADAAIVQNAGRMNPNVGSATSQAEMGAGTGPLAMLAGAAKTIRSPLEAALAAMSKSGAYNQKTRDLIWEMLHGEITPENLDRIFPPRPNMPGPGGPRPLRRGPPPAASSAPSPGTPRNPLGNPPAGPPTTAVPPVRGPVNKAGFGGNPTVTGAAGGAVIGSATAPDQNGDGVVDAQDRAMGGFGGMVSGGIAGGALGAASRKLRPKGPPMKSAGYGGRPAPKPFNIGPDGGTSYFRTSNGKEFAVDFDAHAKGGTGVHFSPKGGADGMSPHDALSLSETQDVFKGVIDQVRQDIAANARPVYSFGAANDQLDRIFNQLARKTPAPEGYRWQLGDGAPKLVKTASSPTSMGFGGSKKASEPPNARKPLQSAASRTIAAGAVGAAAGAATAYAQSDDLTGKIGETEQEIAHLNKTLSDFDKADARGKQQMLKDAGYYAGKIDGNIAGQTTEAITQWKAAQKASISKAEKDRTNLQQRDALQRHPSDPLMDLLRDAGPTALAIGVGFGFKGLRGRAAKASIPVAKAEARTINKMVTNGPVTNFINKAGDARPANLNQLWQKGGAKKDELPFISDGLGKWKVNKNAKPADQLFTDSDLWKAASRYFKGKDAALILGSLGESAFMQTQLDKANADLKTAEEEWKNNPSDETYQKVLAAKNNITTFTVLQRLGWAVAGGRVLGAVGAKYAKVKPNIVGAATEQAGIQQYIAASKPPPRPRTPRNPLSAPPSSGSPVKPSSKKP